jgi:hypothetical protein
LFVAGSGELAMAAWQIASTNNNNASAWLVWQQEEEQGVCAWLPPRQHGMPCFPGACIATCFSFHSFCDCLYCPQKKTV